jgi:hypothetical protein
MRWCSGMHIVLLAARRYLISNFVVGAIRIVGARVRVIYLLDSLASFHVMLSVLHTSAVCDWFFPFLLFHVAL